MSQFLHLIESFPAVMFFGLLSLTLSAVVMHGTINVFNLKRPTIPAIFYFTYIIMIFLPSFLVYRDHPGPYRDAYIISVMAVMVLVPLGIFFCNRLLGFQTQETEAYFSAPPKEPDNFGGMFLTHVAIISFLFLILADYLFHAPVLPIVELLKGSSDPMALTLAREEAFKLLDPRWKGPNGTVFFYAFLFMRTVFFPLLIVTTLGYALYTKKIKWVALFLATLLVGGFYAVSSLARAPISAIFMRVFFFLFLFFSGRVSKKMVAVFFVLMLAFPLLVTTFANSTDRTLWDGLVAVGIRLTYAPALDLYYYFEIFPAFQDYLYGHTLLKPFLQLFGASYFYIENYVAIYISPYGVQSAHSNAAFPSNLHADFGLFGVTMGSFICGVIMQGAHIVLVRSQKTILNMAVYSFMIYAIWVLNFGSVTSVLFVNGALPVLLVAGVIHIASVIVSKRGALWPQRFKIFPRAMPQGGEV